MESNENIENSQSYSIDSGHVRSLVFNSYDTSPYLYHLCLNNPKPQGLVLSYYGFYYYHHPPSHSSWSYTSPSITSTKVYGDDFWLDYDPVHKFPMTICYNHDPFLDEIHYHSLSHEIESNTRDNYSGETNLVSELFNSDKTCERSYKIPNKKKNTKPPSETYKSKESRKIKPSTPIDYPCMICEESFDKVLDFRAHIKAHKIDPPFRCIVCKKEYKHKQNLVQHWISLNCRNEFDEWVYLRKSIQLDKIEKAI